MNRKEKRVKEIPLISTYKHSGFSVVDIRNPNPPSGIRAKSYWENRALSIDMRKSRKCFFH